MSNEHADDVSDSGSSTDHDGEERDEAVEPESEGSADTGVEEEVKSFSGDEEDRKEYYLSLIRSIVDEQRELLGEKVALKQARRAPLHIDKDGKVVDFYGDGKQALKTLRQFTDNQEFYLQLIREVVSTFEEFLGKKTALSKARKAPLFIDKDGQVSAYYGNGRNALDILVSQFESVLGKEVAHLKIRDMIRRATAPEQHELLPERIQPSKEQKQNRETLINRIVERVKRGLHAAES